MDATLAVSVYDALVIFGVTALAISHVYRIFNLFWFYFLRPSSVKRYLHGSGPYAVVTGARHGTGKATAAELLRRGFNFMIHGRNEANMQRVVEELGASVTMDIRYFIADASKGDHEWKRLLEPFGELHIAVVVHNVGGEPLVDTRINTHRETYLLGVVHAKLGPVRAVVVSSFAGDFSPPRLPMYAASKSFLKVLTRGLVNDELTSGAPTGVRFTYLFVCSVHFDYHPTLMSFSMEVPTRTMHSRWLMKSIPCGWRDVALYIVHATQYRLVKNLKFRD